VENSSVVTVWSPLITDALDEVVERGGRDACAAADVHDLERAGGRELVDGAAPDPEACCCFWNRQQQPL